MDKVPRSFNLGPHEIAVKVVSKAEMKVALTEPLGEDEDVPLGLWLRDENTIYVQRVRRGFSKSMQMHTFWHETTHAVLEVLGYDKLSSDERFVDRIGMMLQQAHQTFTF